MELTIYKNHEFGSVRATSINGDPWFVGKDVAEILGYSKARNAISAHVDPEDKKDAPIQGTLGGVQSMTIINESGVYSLIFGSKLPKAKRFKHWVTSEVLPSIRKHGAYATEATIDNILEDPDFGIRLLNQLKEERQKTAALKAKNEEMLPKAIFADAVSASHSTILIGELAKILKANGVDTGQNRLFEVLRKDGFLINRKGTDYNMPTQKSMELGLMVIKETAITHSDGHVSVTKTPKVTGKGQQYFVNFYCKKKATGQKGSDTDSAE